jgi:hypothetical protein
VKEESNEKLTQLWDEYVKYCGSLDHEAAPSFESYMSQMDETPIQRNAQPDMTDVPAPTPVVEKLTLRRRNGNLLGNFEMTRNDFVAKFNPLFEQLVVDKKDSNTYKGW